MRCDPDLAPPTPGPTASREQATGRQLQQSRVQRELGWPEPQNERWHRQEAPTSDWPDGIRSHGDRHATSDEQAGPGLHRNSISHSPPVHERRQLCRRRCPSKHGVGDGGIVHADSRAASVATTRGGCRRGRRSPCATPRGRCDVTNERRNTPWPVNETRHQPESTEPRTGPRPRPPNPPHPECSSTSL